MKPKTAAQKAREAADALVEGTTTTTATPEPTASPVIPVVITLTTPPPPPAPTELEIVKDGEQGKRYLSKTDPGSKYHLRDRSDTEKPVSVVRGICNANPDLARKEVLALCIAAGVNKNTAMTQYSLWKAKQNTATRVAGATSGLAPHIKCFDADGNEVTDEE